MNVLQCISTTKLCNADFHIGCCLSTGRNIDFEVHNTTHAYKIADKEKIQNIARIADSVPVTLYSRVSVNDEIVRNVISVSKVATLRIVL